MKSKYQKIRTQAVVVFGENQETFLFCGQQAESAFTCYTACDQRCLPLLCQRKSCGSILGSKVWVQKVGQPIMFNINKSTCCLFSTCVMVLSDRKWTYLARKLVQKTAIEPNTKSSSVLCHFIQSTHTRAAAHGECLSCAAQTPPVTMRPVWTDRPIKQSSPIVDEFTRCPEPCCKSALKSTEQAEPETRVTFRWKDPQLLSTRCCLPFPNLHSRTR